MKWGFTHEWIVFTGKQGGERYMFADVLYAKRELPSETHHATAKPVSIITKTFEASSNPEDIVLDLFGGSGSTLIACEKTNRICYMSEIDPKYCDVIIKRYEDYTGNKAKKL
jgi:DNA modification methylase